MSISSSGSPAKNGQHHNEEGDASLMRAVDTQDENALGLLFRRPFVALSIETVDAAFILSVASQNLGLIQAFFKTVHRPRQSTVDGLFIEHAQAGTSPEIVYILQNWSSPSVRAEQQRMHMSLRKEYGQEANGHYVVSPSEEMLLKELSKDIARHDTALRSAARKANSTGDGRLQFQFQSHALLRYQMWMNDLLLDSVQENRKLLLYRLLCLPFSSAESDDSTITITTGGEPHHSSNSGNSSSGGSKVEAPKVEEARAVAVFPSGSTVDEAFEIAMMNGWLGTAEILVSFECRTTNIIKPTAAAATSSNIYKLRADRRSLNEALEYAIENCMFANVSWLLNGSSLNGGFLPDQEVIDNLYEKYAIYPSLPQNMYPDYLRARRRFGRGRAAELKDAQERSERQQQIDTLCTNWATSMKLLQLHSSCDIVDRVRRKRSAAAAGASSGGTARMRYRGENDTDIHSFSRTTVNVHSSSSSSSSTTTIAAAAALRDDDGDSDHDQENENESEKGSMECATTTPLARGVSAGTAKKPARMTLNSAVEALIISRTENLSRLTLQEVNSRLVELIQRNFSEVTRQQAAVGLLGQILNSRSAFIIGCTIQFLEQQQFSSSSSCSPCSTDGGDKSSTISSSRSAQNVDIWLQGFLGESILVNSCNPGALERVVTGLRGVADPELNALFGQAEGPIFARNFISGHFNVFFDPSTSNTETQERATRNAKSIAGILLQRGVEVSTPWVRVEEVLTQYMCSEVSKYGVDLQSFMPEITCVVELLEDGYDLYIKQYIVENKKAAAATTIEGGGRGETGQPKQQYSENSYNNTMSLEEWQEFESYVEKYSPEKPSKS